MNLRQLELARSLTLNCTLNYKLACIITDKQGKLMSVGWNSSKTHPIQARYAAKTGHHTKIYLHAEIAAIIKSKGRGWSMYIVRVTKNGNWANSRPCPVCQLAIREAGIRNVWYTTTTGIHKL